MSRPVTVNAIDTEPRGWTASRRTDVDKAVRTAGRHSIAVRVVRIVLPIGVIVGLSVLVLFTYFSPMQMLDKLPKVSGKLAVQGSKITMELPRIAGFTRDSRAYELNAETAVQDIASPDVVELLNLRAKMEMQDKDVINLIAKSGTYNTKGDKIILREQITITSTQGYSARLQEAAVEMKKGDVVSEKPVEITLPNGLLKANSLQITNSGEVILFGRGVVLTIDPEKPAGASQ